MTKATKRRWTKEETTHLLGLMNKYSKKGIPVKEKLAFSKKWNRSIYAIDVRIPFLRRKGLIEKGKKRFTTKENQVICDSVKRHPLNLMVAFKEASSKIDRSAESIRWQYYANLRGKENLFSLVGFGFFTKNRKVLTERSKKGVQDIKKPTLKNSFITKMLFWKSKK